MQSPSPVDSPLLQERGQVVASRDNTVLVRATSRANCARCEAGEGCGGGVIGRLLGDRLDVVTARVEGATRAVAGDQVLLSISGRVLVEAAATAYLLPLVILLCALALAAEWLDDVAPWLQIAYAGGALLLGLAATRALARWRRTSAWQPRARVIRQGDAHSSTDGGPACG